MNIKQLNTDLKSSCHAKGIKGRGIIFAVVDTGVSVVVPNVTSGNLWGTFPSEAHGTMVASVISQWCPDAKILAYNTNRSGDLVNVALEDVLKRVKADTKSRYIVNLSFTTGWSQHTDQMHELIKQLVAKNVPVFAGAGNDGKEALGLYPATWQEPICIAALNSDGIPAPFSNHALEMDFADDGVDVDVLSMDGTSVKVSGTSFATPTAASKAGLILCQNPKLTEPELFSAMKSNALDMYKTGFDANTGWGFVSKCALGASGSLVSDSTPNNPQIPIKDARRVLRLSRPYMRGEDVKDAQCKLTAHGFPCGKIDGIFGKLTDTATRAFQMARNLVLDGVIGKRTWAALDAQIRPIVTNRIAHFITYLKGEVANGSIYVWGAQGQKDITEAWIRKRETSTKNADRAIKLWKIRLLNGFGHMRAFDCSGLIVYYLNREGLYKTDLSANGLYGKSVKLKREELREGDLVFRHNLLKAYHVGIYIGNGQVIEPKGRDDGVVMRDINASGSSYWNRYGRLGLLEG